MDRHSRRIVGWHCAEDMTETLVLKVLRSAIRLRQPAADLIHHTDRGGQYAGHEYRRVLRRDAAEHEPTRQLLRQRLHGILLWNHQDRTGYDRI